ncbi:MAG TPA: NAD(P)-dependent oxidoreductase [Muribaculaceae bacterium]|jgi:D-3-phosphoglycerate dehydrogenase|nr:NAD(P)-dependent oxidoreductase [Muribaculaceae bacterium]
MKVLIATQKPFAKAAVDSIKEVIANAGFEPVMLEKYAGADDLKKAVADADAIIIRSDIIDADVLAAAPKLKIVVRAGAGYDNVDLATAKAQGVVVQNTPGQNSNAVAELVFGMTVMAIRNMYDGTSGSELRGKTIGIQAFGQVGRNVARIAKGFDMTVSALDPYCPAEDIAAAGVTPVQTVNDLYSNNQFVSIHIPATAETRGSIGYDLIRLMPQGGVLINTARKEVIDEAGLAKALEERPDLKYVADVKPDNADELKERFGNRVFFTPKKMGAQTAEANINAGIAAAEQVVAYLRDGINRFQVNK